MLPTAEEVLSTAEMSSGEELMSTADRPRMLSNEVVLLPTTRPNAAEDDGSSSTAEKMMSFHATGMLSSAAEEASSDDFVSSNTRLHVSMQSNAASRYLSSSWISHLPRTVIGDQRTIVTSFSDSLTAVTSSSSSTDDTGILIPGSHNSTNFTASVHAVMGVEGVGGSGSPAMVATGVSLSPMAVQFVIVGALFGTVLLLGLANVLLYLRRTGQMRTTVYSVSHLCDRRIKHHNNQRQIRYNCRRTAVTPRGGQGGNGRSNHRTVVRMKSNHFAC